MNLNGLTERFMQYLLKQWSRIINQKWCCRRVIDLSGLKKMVTDHDNIDVLNGIAYNNVTGTLFVTGKMWDKIFEIEILKK